MNKKICFLINAILTSVVVSSSAFAVTGEIKRIYPTSDVVYFRLKNDTCISGSQYYYFRMNEADFKGQYAAKKLVIDAVSKCFSI
jgi:hypothetical protein